jgi:hypothetical protein
MREKRQCLQRNADRGVTLARAMQAREERLFEQPESSRRTFGAADALSKLAPAPSPERFQIDVPVGELAARHSEEREGASGPEMHADHRALMERVDRKRRCIRTRHQRAGQVRAMIRLRWMVDSQLVLAQVDDQLDRTAWQDAVLAASGLISVVEPEVLHESRERRGGKMRPVNCSDPFFRPAGNGAAR